MRTTALILAIALSLVNASPILFSDTNSLYLVNDGSTPLSINKYDLHSAASQSENTLPAAISGVSYAIQDPENAQYSYIVSTYGGNTIYKYDKVANSFAASVAIPTYVPVGGEDAGIGQPFVNGGHLYLPTFYTNPVYTTSLIRFSTADLSVTSTQLAAPGGYTLIGIDTCASPLTAYFSIESSNNIGRIDLSNFVVLSAINSPAVPLAYRNNIIYGVIDSGSSVTLNQYTIQGAQLVQQGSSLPLYTYSGGDFTGTRYFSLDTDSCNTNYLNILYAPVCNFRPSSSSCPDYSLLRVNRDSFSIVGSPVKLPGSGFSAYTTVSDNFGVRNNVIYNLQQSNGVITMHTYDASAGKAYTITSADSTSPAVSSINLPVLAGSSDCTYLTAPCSLTTTSVPSITVSGSSTSVPSTAATTTRGPTTTKNPGTSTQNPSNTTQSPGQDQSGDNNAKEATSGVSKISLVISLVVLAAVSVLLIVC
jgi:hypothetical protein